MRFDPSFFSIVIVSLSNHDGDGNENVKKGVLMSKTMVLHASYIFWYISLPCSAKQQREMTSFKVLGEPGTHHGEFFFVYLNLSAVPTNSVRG